MSRRWLPVLRRVGRGIFGGALTPEQRTEVEAQYPDWQPEEIDRASWEPDVLDPVTPPVASTDAVAVAFRAMLAFLRFLLTGRHVGTYDTPERIGVDAANAVVRRRSEHVLVLLDLVQAGADAHARRDVAPTGEGSTLFEHLHPDLAASIRDRMAAAAPIAVTRTGAVVYGPRVPSPDAIPEAVLKEAESAMKAASRAATQRAFDADNRTLAEIGHAASLAGAQAYADVLARHVVQARQGAPASLFTFDPGNGSLLRRPTPGEAFVSTVPGGQMLVGDEGAELREPLMPGTARWDRALAASSRATEPASDLTAERDRLVAQNQTLTRDYLAARAEVERLTKRVEEAHATIEAWKVSAYAYSDRIDKLRDVLEDIRDDVDASAQEHRGTAAEALKADDKAAQS